MRPLIEELKLLITTAHNEATNLKFSQNALKKAGTNESQASSSTSIRAPSESVARNACDEFRSKITATLKGILANLEFLELERAKWWMDPARKRIRNQTLETYDAKKYTTLNKFNNDMADRLSDIRAKVGVFSRWQIGIDTNELGDQ